MDDGLLQIMGRVSSFTTMRTTAAGYILKQDGIEVLLPYRLARGKPEPGDTVKAFVYTDSEDRPIATMQSPAARVGEFAYLKVVDENHHGVFLDWGLDKDLFCPRSEQFGPMRLGSSHVVAVYLDNHTGRIAAAGKIAQFLDYDLSEVPIDQKVDLLVFSENARGAQVIVQDRYAGMVFSDKNFRRLDVGTRLTGYVEAIRPDNKLDIRLDEQRPAEGKERLSNARDVILSALDVSGGVISVGDKSPPAAIYEALGISKKAFKAAVGQLYKDGLVVPGDDATKRTEAK